MVRAKCGLSKEEFANLYNRLINASFLLGLTIGPLTLSLLVPHGRRKWLLIFGVIGIIGTAMCLVEEIWTLIVGRFIHGFAIAIYLGLGSRMVDETVPQHLLSSFGNYTNIMINFGLMLVMLSGAALPQGDNLTDD